MEDSVNVLKFAEARAREIASLVDDVNSRKNKTAVQRLPPHMRRRAASHNPKRVPRKLRDSYLIQNPHATSKPKKAPKKMRKKQQKKRHEKQSKNYPEEYASRSRPDAEWLETHIWHAKRCKMINLWGYKIPLCCNDRKLGATHQAATKHAMLQDMSYYCCIELKGPQDQLFLRLSCLTDPNTGCQFSSEMFLDGSIEGHTFLYKPKSFPYEAIGPVTFIWKPLQTESKKESNIVRQLWIWCHPSFHEQLVAVLAEIFLFQKVTSKSVAAECESVDIVNKTGSEEKKDVVFASKVNFAKTKKHFQNENRYINGNTQMNLLKGKLVRHRLIGPNAQSVITNVLALADVESSILLRELSSNQENIVSNHSQLSSENCHEDNYVRNSKKPKLDSDVSSGYQCDSNSKKLNSIKKESKVSGAIVDSSKTLKRKIDTNETLEGNIPSQFSSISNGIQETHLETPVKKIKLDINNESEKVTQSNCNLWWKSYYKLENHKASHVKRRILIECLRNSRSGYYIPPNTVIGFTVRDPRLILNRDKQKFSSLKDCSDMGKYLEELLTEISDSPLWEEDIRKEVTATQIPESEINEERAKYVVPSESFNMGDKESRIPVLLIKQAGVNGFGGGWDLITPLGWGMAFWIPLILNGGRVTGWKDLNFVNLETGQASFPLSFPDMKAGATYEENLRKESLVTYFKRPPAKRPNFITFGTPNPFYMPWEVLVKDWKNEFQCNRSSILFPTESPNVQNMSCDKNEDKRRFFVLRQKEVRKLQYLCERLCKMPKGNNSNVVREWINLKQVYNEFVLSSLDSQKQFFNSLVLVRFKCLSRGCPSEYSGVYALSDSDLEEVKRNPNFLGPVEPNHTKHKGDVKSKCSSSKENLDSHNKKEDVDDSKNKCLSIVESVDCTNKKEDIDPTKDLPVKTADSKEEKNVHSLKESKALCNDQVDPKKLEKPHLETLKSCSSRNIIGYISEGGFSSILGKGCGIGHCSFLGLLYIIKNCINAQLKPYVLLREQHSFQYRTSLIEIIPNYL